MSSTDTVMLIHGLWMTPRSWEHWVKFYEARGCTVLTPAYPGLEVEVEALNADPSPIAALTVEAVVNHYAAIIEKLPVKPVLMGHSFGGAVVQMLLNRGLGSAGVAIDAAAVKGVLKVPLVQLRALWPVFKSPGNKSRAVPLTPKQFNFAFTNTMNEADSLAVWKRYVVPGPGRIVFDGASQNFASNPPTKVDFSKPDRAPLLFLAGELDHTVPASVNRSNFKKYKSGTVAFHEFKGRDHFTCGAPGWEEVATFALDWARSPKAGEI